MAPQDGIDAQAFEAELTTLPDVKAARVVTASSGRITEIHLISEGEKSPKQIVRDVQTVAQARLGLEIDHRIVSIVRMPVALQQQTAPTRLSLASVSWTTEGTRATCRVRVEFGDENAIGEATGAATTVSPPRLVAQAASMAITNLAGQHPTADVDDVLLVDVGRHRVAVAFVIVLDGTSERVITGSAPVRGDDNDAIARAVLDAVNRYERE